MFEKHNDSLQFGTAVWPPWDSNPESDVVKARGVPTYTREPSKIHHAMFLPYDHKSLSYGSFDTSHHTLQLPQLTYQVRPAYSLVDRHLELSLPPAGDQTLGHEYLCFHNQDMDGFLGILLNKFCFRVLLACFSL